MSSTTQKVLLLDSIDLTRLPIEVLQHICAICNHNSHGRDVRNLSLCSRFLRGIVIAYTFPSVTLRGYPAPSAHDVDWLLDHPNVIGRILRLDIRHSIWTKTSVFIQTAHSLQRLTLTRDRIQLGFALALVDLPNLSWLQLDECEISAEFQEYIQNTEPGRIPTAPSMRHVRLAFPHNAIDADDFASWGMLTLCGTSLQRLDLGASRFAVPERDDWDHYVRPMRALQHLELWTLEGDHVLRLVEFLRVVAPLSLKRFEIRAPNLKADELQNLIGQLSKLSPRLSIVEMNVWNARVLAELQTCHPSISFNGPTTNARLSEVPSV